MTYCIKMHIATLSPYSQKNKQKTYSPFHRLVLRPQRAIRSANGCQVIMHFKLMAESETYSSASKPP